MDIKEEVEKVFASIRPYLQVDNGDIEFVRYDEEDKVLEVRFLGMCRTCPLSQMTLRAGIERFILKNIPEIKRIEAVL